MAKTAAPGPDAVRIGSWLRQLEITRRLCHLYGSRHPATEPGRRRLLEVTRQLGPTPALVKITPLGFELTSALLGDAAAGSERLAEQLCGLGIVALGLQPPIEGPSVEGLLDLATELKDRPTEEDREKLVKKGTSLTGIRLIPLDVDWIAFSAVLTSTKSTLDSQPWRELARAVAGAKPGEAGPLSPPELARRIEGSAEPGKLLERLVRTLIQLLDDAEGRQDYMDGLTLLAAVDLVLQRLPAALQRQAVRLMVSQVGSSRGLRARLPELAQPELLIAEAEDLLRRGSGVPAAVRVVVGRIADSREPERRSSAGTPTGRSPDTVRRARMLRDRLSAPRAARDRTVAAGRPAYHQLSSVRGLSPNQDRRHELQQQFGDRPVRRHLEQILRLARQMWPQSRVAERSGQRLARSYFERLELGEFEEAAAIVREFVSGGDRALLARVTGTEGLEALLDAVDVWGKDHRRRIVEIATMIGEELMPVILQGIETEEKMSRRRRLLEMTLAIGERAVPHLHRRLDDPRWYVVRNVVFLLRRIGDPTLPERVAKLVHHDEPRVVSEVVRALSGVGDGRWLDALRELLERDDPMAVREALALVTSLGKPELGPILLEQLARRRGSKLRDEQTLELIRALGSFPQREVEQELYELATLPAWRYGFRLTPVWEAVADAAARLPAPAGDRVLDKIAEHRDPSAETARRLLERRQEGQG